VGKGGCQVDFCAPRASTGAMSESDKLARVALIVAAMAFALSILGLFLPIG